MVEKHGLVVRKGLRGKVDLVLGHFPYNVQTDRKYYHVGKDVFDQNDTKDMANVLGDVMMPEAHEHVSYSAIKRAL